MKTLYFILLSLLFFQCLAQTDKPNQTIHVGGPCEGCEAVHEYGDKILSNTTTLPGYAAQKPKLKLTGTVLQSDGVTPAADVVLYIYHTNREGIYETVGTEKGWGKRHGMYRGWIKTRNDGKYTFYTFRPGAYPNGQDPEHIHLTVKEPKLNEYYVENYMFSDDPLLTMSIKSDLSQRAGSGICTPKLDGEYYIISRDIILGTNIPNYPKD